MIFYYMIKLNALIFCNKRIELKLSCLKNGIYSQQYYYLFDKD